MQDFIKKWNTERVRLNILKVVCIVFVLHLIRIGVQYIPEDVQPTPEEIKIMNNHYIVEEVEKLDTELVSLDTNYLTVIQNKSILYTSLYKEFKSRQAALINQLDSTRELDLDRRDYPEFYVKEAITNLIEEVPEKWILLIDTYHGPKSLYYTTLKVNDCYVTQTDAQHFIANRRLATDIGCGNKETRLFAPDYMNKEMEYKVKIRKYKDTGNTVELIFRDMPGTKWLLGHVATDLKTGDTVRTGDAIGRMDKSGITTGYHSHIELWKDGQAVSYRINNPLQAYRQDRMKTREEGEEFYFEPWNPGTVKENDSAPCIAANGKDICKEHEHGNPLMALTKDVRDSYGIDFDDIVTLTGDKGCEGQWKVVDEKHFRYRYSDIKKEGVPIKGDVSKGAGGICTVTLAIKKE